MGLMTEGNRCPAGLQELLKDIFKLNGCCIALFIYLTDAVDSTFNVCSHLLLKSASQELKPTV